MIAALLPNRLKGVTKLIPASSARSREAERPPTRLFLGEDALGFVAQKLEQMKTETAAWDALSRSTSFAP